MEDLQKFRESLDKGLSFFYGEVTTIREDNLVEIGDRQCGCINHSILNKSTMEIVLGHMLLQNSREYRKKVNESIEMPMWKIPFNVKFGECLDNTVIDRCHCFRTS